MGKGRGRFSVESVVWLSPEGKEVQIYNGAEKMLRNSFRSVTMQNLSTLHFALSSLHLSLVTFLHLSLVTWNFLTPTRLVYAEALTPAPDFHVLIRALLRRLSNLAYFHCGAELDLDFRGLIAAAEQIETVNSDVRWYDWERYSARQDARMKLGGFVGKVTYRGNLQPFLPLLRLGETVHIGKGTSFGLGKYVMEQPL